MVETLGELVYEFRDLSGETQSAVARAIGKTTSYISQIETEKVMPSVSTVRKLAKHLGFSEKKGLASYASSFLKRRFKNDGVKSIIKLIME